jgi:hypothetical protein
MSKTKISDYSSTPADNTDIGGINIAEGMLPSDVNNAIREQMAQLKNFQSGTSGESVTFATVNATTISASNINKVTVTAPATGATLTIADGKTLTANNSLTLAGTDATTMTFPSTSATIARTDAAQTFTGTQTFSSALVLPAGTVSAPSFAPTGDTNTGIFFPAADTIAFAEGGAEAMRIADTGQVLIATTTKPSIAQIGLVVGRAGAGGGTIQVTKTVATEGGGIIGTANGPGLVFSSHTGTVGSEEYTERMRIDSGGNVCIGTSSANASRLRVRATSDTDVGLAYITRLNDAQNDEHGLYITADVTNNLLNFDSTGTNAGGFTFRSGATERMRITSSGNLLVGTTSNSSGDNSNGIFLDPIGQLNARRENDSCLMLRRWSTNGTVATFRNTANTTVGTIATAASSTAYNTSSDYRLKENVAPMTGALAKVLELNPVTYTWKVDGSAGEGFIAHELQAVCPEAVTGEKDATEIQQYEVTPAIYEDVVIPAVLDEDGNEVEPERTEKQLVSEAVYEEQEVPVYQGVDTSFLVATLTAAIQELSAKNDALEARISALEQA